MKRAYLFTTIILAVIGTLYLWNHRANFALLRSVFPNNQPEDILQPDAGSNAQWRAVNDSNLGFKVEMPGTPERVVVQANSETGSTEPISMILVKPEDNRSYAIAWAERPPIARVNDLSPDKTLDQARDGTLSRTGSTIVSEIRSTPQGFPGRDIVAHNPAGAMIDARLIYARPRLYMLIVTSPSTSARHEQDIIHFFNSFAISRNASIPQSIPAATE